MPQHDDHTINIIEKLSGFSPFAAIHSAVLEDIARSANWLCIAAGVELFSQGSESDGVYIVLSGRLTAHIQGGGPGPTETHYVLPGELVGEIGVLDAGPRTASIRALRRTELLHLEGNCVARLMQTCPRFSLAVSAQAARRLRSANFPVTPSTAWCIALRSTKPHTMRHAHSLAAALRAQTGAEMLTRDNAMGLTAGQLDEIEREAGGVVYIDSFLDVAWTRLCHEQADHIIIVADGLGSSEHSLPNKAVGSQGRIVDLALSWDGTIRSGHTSRWREAVRPRSHYHLRSSADVERAARLLTGHGVGLVLSGGGARGAAHLGALQALDEAGVSIDAVCGTSIGAVIGAGYALEWDHDQRVEALRSFAGRLSAFDFNLNGRSLYSDRKIKSAIEAAFEDTELEETAIPFSCVSTNLTVGQIAVHDEGPMALWLRATAAVPGFFPPLVHRGEIYVDGGVLDNLPVDVMRSRKPGVIIAVDLGADPTRVGMGDGKSRSPEPRNVIDLLKRVGTISSDSRDTLSRSRCDLVIDPDVSQIGLFEWRSFDDAVEAGYRAAAPLCSLAELRREAAAPAIETAPR